MRTPLSIALLLGLSVLAAGQPAQRRPSVTGRLELIEGFESKILGNRRTIRVWLPPGYAAETGRKYPVAYLHDGQNVFDGATSFIPNMEWRADETAQALIESGWLPPLILVGIDNAGAKRADEYLPTRVERNGQPMGGEADRYGRMIVEELMPAIQARYRVLEGPANTGLIGSSFGGIATLYLGLTRQQVFGRLGVVSPSVWWDDGEILKVVERARLQVRPRVWLDMGGAEGGGALEGARALRDALVKKGWKPGRDFRFYEEAHAEHNEAAWARRIGLLLLHLFGRGT